jgi:exodeoxyribonuclease V alpha subunit
VSAIAEAAPARELAAIDVQFADLVHRLALAGGDRESARVMRLTAALVSRERGLGHPCIELARWAGASLDGDAAASLPELQPWLATLSASPLVGSGETPTPLVLDTAGRCYLYRYWEAEQRLAARIRRDVEARLDDVSAATLAPKFRELFPAPSGGDADRQAVAAAAVLHNRLSIVSGGPGTGKTTTVARILALYAARGTAVRVELAAPTGKAAARLTQALAAETARLAIPPPAGASAWEAKTIHRVLGYRPDVGRFRHDAARPLACDLLVVDEASMIDLLLMDALFAAVPPHARIVLVGDKDQLASVEAGFVFGDLCDATVAAGVYSQAFQAFFRTLSGYDLVSEMRAAPARKTRSARASASPQPDAESRRSTRATLGDCGVELEIGWRFRDRPGIERLAAAVKVCDADAALAALDDRAQSDAVRRDLPTDPVDVVRAVYDTIVAVLTAPSADRALETLGRARIVCATNRGRWGVAALNLLVERELAERGFSTSERWYHGRPVLVSTNDYTLGLFNGDVGVCLPDDEGRMRAWFAGADGARSVAPAKLPDHETAWAMTVHKSQGSEFERVVVVLPERDSQILTRELVYTAVTRAREHVTIFAPADILRTAVKRRAERVSGLRALLADRDNGASE